VDNPSQRFGKGIWFGFGSRKHVTKDTLDLGIMNLKGFNGQGPGKVLMPLRDEPLKDLAIHVVMGFRDYLIKTSGDYKENTSTPWLSIPNFLGFDVPLFGCRVDTMPTMK